MQVWVYFQAIYSVPLICGSIFVPIPNQSILKEISPDCSLEGLMLKLQYFGQLMQRTDSSEKTLMLGKIEGRRRSEWVLMSPSIIVLLSISPFMSVSVCLVY